MHSISFQTEIEALKKAMVKMDRLPKTNLINVILPLIDNILPFQQDNLALTLANKVFQVSNLLGLDPIRIPRKENILSLTLQERIFVATIKKLESKLIPITILLWKLTHNPETI